MSDQMIAGPEEIDTSPTSNLPDEAWYDCTLLYVDPDESSRGNPMCVCEWKIDRGEYAGFDGIREYWELNAPDHTLGASALKKTMKACEFDWEGGPWNAGEFTDQFPNGELRAALKFEYRYTIKENGEYNDVPQEEWEDYDGEKTVGLEIASRKPAQGEPDEAESDGITWEEDSDVPDDFEDDDSPSSDDDAPF